MSQLLRSRFIRQLWLGMISLFCVISFAACGSAPSPDAGAISPGASPGTGTPATATVLKIGSDAAFAPMEFQKDGKIIGFSIDLMNAIGEAAGFKPEFQNSAFDGLVASLQAGQIDAVVSSMTITKERMGAVDFSRPYFKSGLAIAVKADNSGVTTLDSLKGKTIAVQIGTTGAAKAKEIPGAQVREFETAPLALQELANGNAEAVINDAPVTQYAIKSGGVKGLTVVGQLVTEEFYGIALPKNSPNLEKINTGLATVINNGKYKQIYEQWIGGEPPNLPEKASV